MGALAAAFSNVAAQYPFHGFSLVFPLSTVVTIHLLTSL